jgi:hypothetical protein
MKNISLILAIGLFLVLPLASAVDIGYIVRDVNHVDNSLVSAINETYSYNIIYEKDIKNSNLSEYKMILIGDGLFSNASAIPVNNYNSLILNSLYYSQWGWSSSVGQTTASFLQLRNNKINVSVTENLKDTFFVYNSRAISAYYLNGKRPVLTKISYGENIDPTNVYVAYVDKGTKMLNGNTTNGRSLFFGLTNTDSWTEDTKQLFMNSLNWTMKGQDRDMDGYYDGDCDDNNANLWQLLPGYLDSDGDGFGSGNLIMVCSGESLPVGYSEIGGDCDDTINSVNPNGTEVAYDGLDNDCSNGDLADVDGDGFNAVIVGGTDCNDSDLEINPNSTDPLKNCVNDAPVLNLNIPGQIWAEDSYRYLNLSDYFSDPEGENLTYSVASSGDGNVSIDIIGNLVRFASQIYWFGNSWVIFQASDGNNQTLSNKIDLIVGHVNHNPVLSQISDVYAIAGQVVNVVPNATDVDNDNLTYEFSLPLNESGQWKTSEGDEDDYQVNVIVRDGHGGSDIEHFTIFVMPKFKINEVYLGSNGWVELYNPGNKNVNLDSCLIINNGNTYQLNGILAINEIKAFDIFNLSNSKIELKCNGEMVDEISFGDLEDAPIPSENQSVGRVLDGANNFALFDIPTKGLSNSADMIAPIVNLENPQKGIVNIRDIELGFNVSDNSQNLTCELYRGTENLEKISSIIVNLINGFASGNFSLNGLDDGIYKWNVKCIDSRNSAFASDNGTFEISAPDAPVLNYIGNKIINENQTIEFSVFATDKDNDILSYYAENLPKGAVFNSGKFSWTPDFNQSGVYNVKFIVKDGLNLTDSELVAMTVNDVKLPPKFTDIEKCENSNLIVMDIKNPDENDILTIGSITDVDLRIKNNGNASRFNVNTYLYDIVNDVIIENSNSRVKIEKSDSQDINLQLKVPEDINETSKYAIYVSAEDGNLCNSKFIYVKTERADDKVIIKKFDVNPIILSNGQTVEFTVKLQNTGKNDQDNIYIVIKNSDLKLNIKSDYIDLEAYGGDDSITKRFTFTIPENVTGNNYNITATVFYNGESDEAVKTITIEEIQNPNNLEFVQNDNTQTYTTGTISEQENTEINIEDTNARTYRINDLPVVSYTENASPVVKKVETGKVNVPSYMKDKKVNVLLYILNVFFIAGILIFILRLIFYIRKRK